MDKQWFYLLHTPFDELEKIYQEQIYKSYYIFVYRELYNLLADHALTEDLIHESFLKVISKAPHLQSTGNIPAWIKRVAYTTTIDFIRKTSKEKETLALITIPLHYEIYHQNNVEMVWDSKWKNAQLYDAIGKLDNTNRRLLKMFYIEGKSCKEISKIMDITETTTSKRLSRARQRLRQLISLREKHQMKYHIP